jgi:hypothetical protein
MSYSCWFGGHFDVVERGIERKSRLARFLLDQRANPLGQGVYNDATASLRLARSIVTENLASGGDDDLVHFHVMAVRHGQTKAA